LSMAEKVLAETDKFSAGADKIFSETDRFLDETERLLFDPERPLSDPEVFSGLEERIWAETKKLFSETDRVLGDAEKFMKQTDRLLDEAEETLEKIEGRPKISPKRRRRAGKRRRGPKNFRKGRERAGDFGKTFFSGLEPVEVRPLVKIGERTNVAGSRLFLKFIQEEAYEKALGLAREMIDQGAQILNVCMDDPLLDAPGCLTRFLTLALSDPDIAKVPIMLDSSRWETLETGLKLLQGKGIVNSLSLKDGESEFLRKARLARRYGAAIMVMLFDEKGQAATFPRKIEVAGRAYRLLTAAGIPPEDILFDAVVLTIATGIPDHDRYALDFFKACRWISRNCPGAKVSGGIANLSFSFQGNEGIRAALHSVFLKHAEDAGLSLAIVNPGTMIPYDSLDPALRTAAEDLILCRKPQAAEELLQFALPKTEKTEGEKKLWRTESPENRIIHAMLKGIDDYIEADVLELRPQVPKPLDIIEGPLMEGMRKVGDLFGEGKLFLPQVIRSARVMQKAVSALTPYLGQEKKGTGKILLATVKGDVHDIGKNFVGVVLSCNGWEVLDLGVMVPAEKIAETARQERADLVGLSGLITPSLDEMIRTAQEMNRQGLRIPLLIGGATASLAHTALRIAPEYSGPVVYIRDASRSAQAVRALLSPLDREPFLAKLQTEYQQARNRHAQLTEKRNLLSFAEARDNRFIPNWSLPQNNPEPKVKGVLNLSDYPISRAAPYLDWQAFLGAWDAGPAGGETLLKDAQDLLEDIQTKGLLTLRGALGFFPAASVNEDALIFDAPEGKEIARFSFLRDQRKKSPGEKNLCLADFLPQADEKAGPIRAPGWLGAFVLSAGFGLEKAQTGPDKYRRLLLGTLANALTEAFAEEIHQRVRREWWGYSPNENLSKEELFAGKYPGLRPALGYPVCPDHQDKGIVLNLLDPEGRCGFTLTESGMLIPGAAVCGLYFAHPEARYFGLGPIGADQLQDWAIRKNLSLPAAEKRIASL
jgi:5-methyltetrahydrofolate--homocysteine methyltransferase